MKFDLVETQRKIWKDIELSDLHSCCEGMNDLLAQSKERGFSIGLIYSYVNPKECLGPRLICTSVDEKDIVRLPYSPVAISIASELPILFCPFCGEKIRSNKKWF